MCIILIMDLDTLSGSDLNIPRLSIYTFIMVRVMSLWFLVWRCDLIERFDSLFIQEADPKEALAELKTSIFDDWVNMQTRNENLWDNIFSFSFFRGSVGGITTDHYFLTIIILFFFNSCTALFSNASVSPTSSLISHIHSSMFRHGCIMVWALLIVSFL